MDGVIDVLNYVPDPVTVAFEPEKINRHLGTELSREDMVMYLNRLGFTVDGDQLHVPSWRTDIHFMADVAEEVARMYGYDNIPVTTFKGAAAKGGYTPEQKCKNQAGQICRGMGYSEILTYSFGSPSMFDQIRLPEDSPLRKPIKILNPPGEDTSVMRSTLVPGMLKTLALNMNHGNETARLYEAAAVFDPLHPTAEGLPTETQTLCLGVYGKEEDFYTLRGAVEQLLRHRGIAFDIVPGGESYHHPGRCARLMQGETVLCALGEVHPAVRENFDMPARALVAEINLETIAALSPPMGAVKPMPRYPAVSRDLSLVMAESTSVGPLMADMAKAAGAILEDVKLFDVYRSAALGADMKSVAFAFVFRGADRTLTEQEITAAMDKILKVAAEKYNAVIRS